MIKRVILLLSAIWIFLLAVTPEYTAAANIYRRIYGKDPPPPKQWQIIAHEQDGSQPLYRVNKQDKIVDIYLHKGQRQAWDSGKRFVFIIAGKQSGKTIFGPLWLFREILRLGKGDYLAISATADLFNAKMLPALRQFFEDDLGIAKYHAGDRMFELCDFDTGKFGAISSKEFHKMHGRIILRTAESEAGVQSFSAKAAWMDEPGLYRPTVWKDVRGRVSLVAGPILGTTTPYDMGWLKQQIYDLWKKAKGDHKTIDVINFISTVNPFFSQAEYEDLRESMQAYQFALDYMGLFERPPAAIYEDFIDADRYDNKAGHKVKRFIIPVEWPRMVAVDPGIINPGKVWIAHDPKEDVYYLYRIEKGGERRDASNHAKDDVKLAKENNERVIWWAVGAKSEKYWRQDYEAAGAKPTREPDSMEVKERIDRFTRLLKERRIYVVDDLQPWIDEIMNYSRELKNGEVTDKIKDKETYHLMDATGYWAMQVVKKRQTVQVSVGSTKYA